MQFINKLIKVTVIYFKFQQKRQANESITLSAQWDVTANVVQNRRRGRPLLADGVVAGDGGQGGDLGGICWSSQPMGEGVGEFKSETDHPSFLNENVEEKKEKNHENSGDFEMNSFKDLVREFPIQFIKLDAKHEIF